MASASGPAPEEAVYSFRLLEALRQGDAKTLRPFLSKAPTTPKGTPVNELTSPLHIAVRCAEYATVQLCLEYKDLDINATEAHHGNTALHIASSLGRADVTQLLLSREGIDDTKRNKDGKDPADLAHSPQIAQLFQVSRAELNCQYLEVLSAWESRSPGAEEKLRAILALPRARSLDLNVQSKSGTTLLHEAVARKDTAMIEVAVRNGADVYTRNRRGKSALDSSKDEKIKALLRQYSNADAAIAAQTPAGHPPTFRGYLGKWTNLAGGYKVRWFVLQDGVLSYYHTQEEEGKSSRGSVNLRFAKIRASSNDKHRFEVISEATAKGTSKLYLRGSHPVERARWVAVLQQTQDHFDLSRTASRTDGPAGSVGSNPTASGSVSNLSLAPSRSTTPALARSSLSTNTNNAILGTLTTSAPLSASRPESIQRTPSMTSIHSLASEQGDSDGLADAEPLFDADGKPRIPHSETMPLIQSSLGLKIEQALQLAASIPATADGGVKATLQDALAQIESLSSEQAKLVGEREAYLLRRYEQEISAKHLWEENMKTLAQQHADMEDQLQEAAQDNAKKRKALREIRDNIGASPSAGVLSPVPQRGALSLQGTIADRRDGAEPLALDGVPTKPVARGSMSGLASGSAGGQMTETESVGDDDEFFDAIESGNLPGLKVETPMQEEMKEADWPEDFNRKQAIDDAALEPYRHLRTKLPIGSDDRPSVSLWAILKNNIGKDLTKISFPVAFNEPTSMLQRMAEDMEFSECLDAAATQEDSTKRIAFVAAFAMSNYSSTIGRVAKPFNPMLGESFEYMRPDKHYRYISEQVCHHPPVSACLAQSPLWDYLGCVDAKSKFLGRTFEIRPTGVAHARLKISKDWLPKAGKGLPEAGPLFPGKVIEHYTWNKVTTSVSGFIVGSPTIDHVGDLTVENHATGDKCTLTFKPRGWRGGAAREISGQVWNGAGKLVWEIAGKWDSQLVARKAGAGKGTLNPDESVQGGFSAESNPLAEYLLLWKNSVKPANLPFNLTPFAITLNDLPKSLPKWLPPTDCRVRPDLVSFEEGRFDEANGLKQSLEDYQRQTRKKRETGELPPHEPRWFTKTIDADSGEAFWQPKVADGEGPGAHPEYWSVRQKVGETGDDSLWGCQHIYGPFESKRIKAT
ncbi:hypothetical protein BCV69DRAFT_282264 [Microstroma glucosiphilum]|uniref:PH domain-containing protein n=1 Tax=Pseudomicrostroma glucosiphilum TaxID=1684307 RepID=A0A316U8K7_9BASI|nr:hypothetical protein BCV69DRAFT_282264 [Pseudomicrostroma glucosiphilum]PWN21546.1 hypothetical protein BCV69DRAFT_282264 [Pseudomicrostroma glucosiphilum]